MATAHDDVTVDEWSSEPGFLFRGIRKVGE